MALALDRQMFETPRSSEYFNVRELQAQTGQHADNFASVLLKELADNAFDACETAGIQPEISIEVSEHDQIVISVHDSGAGISCSTIDKILNFQTRTSDKAAYRSPTRGAQGNALKTVIGIPHALGSTAPVIIESQNLQHSIRARIDPAGELRIDHVEEPIQCNGTKITVAIPHGNQVFFPGSWARRFSIFNPHALVKIRVLKEGIKHSIGPCRK